MQSKLVIDLFLVFRIPYLLGSRVFIVVFHNGVLLQALVLSVIVGRVHLV